MLSRVPRALLGAGLLFLLGLTGPAHALLPARVDGEPLPSLAPMLENVLPAVVNISTTTRIRTTDHPLMQDPFFRRFLGPREREGSSLGSGVIVDAVNGYILTNHHVIDRADEITVTTNDGRSMEATLVGSDEDSDVAVIQVRGDNLQAIAIGRSSELRVGDFVVAIGSPFGLSQTVTSGIVSALGRSGLGIEGYEDFIQTDASINPGNSGGALVNLRGELVGINTAILSRGGGSIGIGLSIPVDMAGALMAQILEHGDVQRGILGVAMQDLTPRLAEAFGIPGRRGAVVSQVVPGSAAEEIGMRSGDVIVGFNNAEILDSADLRNAVGLLRTGDRGTVAFYRGGRLIEREVTIHDPRKVANVQGKAPEGSRFAGASFEGVTSEDGEKAIRVTGIEPGSPAARTGIVPGDVIYSVNRRRIESVDDLSNVVERSDGVLLMRLLRDGRALFLVVK
ncbi:MAG: Do family serine endopeptidase [Gammaproteobacteria bacterium]|nr:Do family serine endopeptidase [Gammaproteobacteria bacterium]MYG67096.1 Do family serine endopeptidase [Gammaproteobacteria bacterium]